MPLLVVITMDGVLEVAHRICANRCRCAVLGRVDDEDPMLRDFVCRLCGEHLAMRPRV